MRASRPPIRVRRSPHLVIYWRRGRLVLRNYATGTAATVPPFVFAILDRCTDWTASDEIRRGLSFLPATEISALLRQLIDRSFLQRSDRPEPAGEGAMRALEPWNPEAGFFHMVTKDVRFLPRGAAARRRPPGRVPDAAKSYRGLPTIVLPPPDGAGEFARVARSRRTWRRFSGKPVTRAELATLLGLSAGVQHWMRIGAGVEVALKTSPSGGARHPIECYVLARHVAGLAPGLYHYAADRHALARLRRGATAAQIRAYLPHSGYFAGASALVLFTALFTRQLWRYRYSRAYRAALIEAGHVCQTFCLASTALGLAPFSVMALADSLIERDLGIDGITESVLYAAGVGRPPAGAASAPRPRGAARVRPNPRMG